MFVGFCESGGVVLRQGRGDSSASRLAGPFREPLQTTPGRGAGIFRGFRGGPRFPGLRRFVSTLAVVLPSGSAGEAGLPVEAAVWARSSGDFGACGAVVSGTSASCWCGALVSLRGSGCGVRDDFMLRLFQGAGAVEKQGDGQHCGGGPAGDAEPEVSGAWDD